jgi:hypothetical protein
MAKVEHGLKLRNGYKFYGNLSMYFTADAKNLYHSLAAFKQFEGDEKDYYLQLRGEVFESSITGAMVLHGSIIFNITFSVLDGRETAIMTPVSQKIKENVLTTEFVKFALEFVEEFIDNEMEGAEAERKEALFAMISEQTRIVREKESYNKTISKLNNIKSDLHLYPKVEKAYRRLEIALASL